ncbi:hypothetical protein M2139_001508 [Enterococcus sp. PF1-24]|uniref:hypothetical protein n=1 Tax=unclassified Enterococcus TaxID=2608891 RepID=UPI0024737D5B|nr:MULTISPECIES: hypothetical protein [unclassified Enterococcus]MDH6364501.1 hypothetical protein [Enterococcus sp. PFB1-1]MDH6401622.1 hypothetical protein [Enterococcus sp. PF1-24]
MNENQQVVLEILKKNAIEEVLDSGVYALPSRRQYIYLCSSEELFEVLQVFATWGLKRERE